MPNAPHHLSVNQISGNNNALSWSFGAASDEGIRSYYEAQWSTDSTLVGGTLANNVTSSLGNGSSGMRLGTPYTVSGSSAWYQGHIDQPWQSNPLGAGTQYYMQVRHTNKQGSSSWTALANATTAGGGSVPSTPGQPSLQASNPVGYDQIKIQWSAVSGVTGYKIYWDQTTGNPTTLRSTQVGTGTTYTMSGLDEAQVYSVRIVAYNATGDSGYSPKYTQSTFWEDEGHASTSNNASTSNTISWDVPANPPAGMDESKLYGDTNNPPTTLISTQSGTGTKTYSHTGLTGGATYYYRVRLFMDYANGQSADTQVASVTNPAGPTVTGLSFSSVGETSVTATWTDTNAQSFRYWIGTTQYASETYAFGQTMAYGGTTTNNNSITKTGLTGGTQYWMYIKPYESTNAGGAVGNGYGLGDNAEGYQTFTTGQAVPSAPGAPSVTAKSTSTIAISWSAVSGATGYKIYYGTSSSPTGNESSQTGTTKTITGLSTATTYYIRLKAYNSGGDSSYGSETTADTTTATPDAPVASSNTDPTEQVITWTAPTGTHTTYLYGTGNNSTSALTSVAVASAETHTIAVTPGSTYYYRVRSITTYHNNLYSDYSAQLTATAASVQPPTSLTYIALSTSTVLLIWSNPTYSDRTYTYTSSGYAIVVPDYETGTSRTFGDGDTVLGSTISLGQNDGFTVKFKNYYDGHYSAYSSDLTVYTDPGPVTNFAAADLSDTEINLTWTEPTMGADGLTQQYLIKFRIDNTGSWTTITSTATGNSYTHTGLTQGTAYYYQIYTSTGALGPAGGLSSVSTANDTTQTGPDPVAGDALGLGALGHATGVNGNATTQTSISACNGGATSEVSFRDFYAGSVGTLTGLSTILYNTSTTITANFSNRGSLFNSRIGSVAGNFTWTRSNTNISIAGSSDYTAVVTANVGGNSTSVVTMTFAGRYNTHSSIPSTSRTKTITCVGSGP